MDGKRKISTTMAVTGTALVWFPVLAPVLLTGFMLLTRQIFLFDYLMPAELSLFALAGAGLLLWAAARERSFVRFFGWGSAAAVILLFGAQGLAVVSGLAHGDTAPEGVWFITVLVMINLYTVTLIILGAGGVRFLRELTRKGKTDEAADTGSHQDP